MKVLATKEQFDEFLKEAGDKLVVIDFYADWCGPCKMIAPKILELENLETGVKFAKVDVDDNEDTAQEQGISAMPTFIFYKNGIKVDEVVGASEEKIKEKIAKNK